MVKSSLLTTKQCRICLVEKPTTEFYKSSRGVYGVGPYCKPCHKDRGKRAWTGYSDTFKQKRRDKHVLTKYKMTHQDYLNLLENQGGCCAMCQTVQPGGNGAFNIDHDHTCCPGSISCGNCIRGLLCQKCNMRLVDSIEWHENAIKYLKNYQTNKL